MDSADEGRGMTWAEGLVFMAFSAVLYVAAVWINDLLPSTRVRLGVDLFFLPAGVKMLAIILGRGWGVPSLWMANFLMARREWADQGIDDLHLFVGSGVWIFLTYLLLLLLLRLFGVRHSLSNLTYMKLVWLVLLGALGHGLVYNLYQIYAGHLPAPALPLSALGMALGDFLGAGALMALWVIGAKSVRCLLQRRSP